MKISKFIFVLLLSLSALAVVSANVFASQVDGTIDSSYKYAWSDIGGWVNFGLNSGSVHVTDEELTGYVWVENKGWISFAPPNGGVLNDGEGNLSGSAWGEQLGWINFDGVLIDSNGKFSGQAVGYLAEKITFDCDYCDVRTDWRPVSVRESDSGHSGGSSGSGGNNNDILDNTNSSEDSNDIVTTLVEGDFVPDNVVDELVPSECGDLICDSTEGCTTCSLDCGACVRTPICGDYQCNGGETCNSCQVDCGLCIRPVVCGDNVCNGGETCGSCSNDCGICETVDREDSLIDVINQFTDIYGENSSSVDTGEEEVLPSSSPASISDINTRAVYTNSSYESEALNLMLEDKADCGGEDSLECLKTIYGLTKIEEERERPLTDDEIGDAIVFNKQPGEIIEIPRIVNLSGKVGSSPAILIVSKPNDQVVVGFLRKNEDGTFLTVMKLQMEMDEGGKGVLRVDNPLSDGQYYAVIYAMRDGVRVNGKGAVFEVDIAIDTEFNIDDFEIVEDPSNADVDKLKLSEFDIFLLSYLEFWTDGGFLIEKYVDVVKGTMKKYIVHGNVNSSEIRDMVVYVTYESVVFGSVVISDASTKGSFSAMFANKMPRGEHTVTVYAYDPKIKTTTSMKVKKFIKK